MSRYNVNYQLANAINHEALIAQTATGKGPSPALWSNCPLLALEYGAKEGFVYSDDFLGQIDVTSAHGWTLSGSGSPTITPVTTLQGGAIAFNSISTTGDQGMNAQLTNCLVKPATGVKIWFEARVKMNDAADQYFVGLAGISTALISGGVVEDSVDKCGFYHEAGSTDDKISAICSRTTVEKKSTDVGDNLDNTFVKLGFFIDGITSVTFYRNGAVVATHNGATTIPNAVMCLSAVSQVEVSTAATIMTWDWVRIAQEGGRA